MVHKLVPGGDKTGTFDRLEERKLRAWKAGVHGKPERGTYLPRPGDGTKR